MAATHKHAQGLALEGLERSEGWLPWASSGASEMPSRSCWWASWLRSSGLTPILVALQQTLCNAAWY
eukprot:6834611-Karenia_brevis.AAC.1